MKVDYFILVFSLLKSEGLGKHINGEVNKKGREGKENMRKREGK